MAHHQLLERVRTAFAQRKGISEKRMFGGHCFFAHGSMIGGVTGDGELIIRVGRDAYANALDLPRARNGFYGATHARIRGWATINGGQR